MYISVFISDWEDEPTSKKQKLSKSKTTPPSKKGVRVFLKSGNGEVVFSARTSCIVFKISDIVK